MVVYTFLESYDFTGKTIIPFCTNEGSGMGSSVRFIKKLCPVPMSMTAHPSMEPRPLTPTVRHRLLQQWRNRSLTPNPSPNGEGSK